MMNNIWSSTLVAIAAALTPMAAFGALLTVYPRAAPGPFWMVPVGVAVGYAILWRRYPDYSYPIGLLLVPLMGAALFAIASLIWWYVTGGYI